MSNRKNHLNKKIFQLCIYLALLLPLMSCVSTDSATLSDDLDKYERKNIEIATGFFRNGYPQRAISRLGKILKKNSRSSRAYGMLGVVYQQQGEYELAQENFKKSLELKSNASDVLNNYGTLLFAMGHYDQANKAFEEVTQDIYYAHRSRAFDNLGFIAMKQGNKAEAKKRFQRALRLEPRLPSSNLALAKIYLSDGYYPEAFQHFQQFDIDNNRFSADILWLGLRIARAVDRMDLVEKYGSTLSKLYPKSDEYRKYEQYKRTLP
ncbi:MAG: type IV pilus biogenesis/stability protein PilW [Endozoicomonadaceae bacterium]|nr:type IV pilus biogenesis/stability protein PilW [Endozoicomonadaceae bacterium]